MGSILTSTASNDHFLPSVFGIECNSNNTTILFGLAGAQNKFAAIPSAFFFFTTHLDPELSFILSIIRKVFV